MNSRMISYFFPYSLFLIYIFLLPYFFFSLFFIPSFISFFFSSACYSLSSLLISLHSHSPVSPSLPLSFLNKRKTTHTYTKFGAKSKGKDEYNNPSSSLSFLLCFPLLNLSHFEFLGEIRRMEKRRRNRDDQARVLMSSEVCCV